MERKEMDRINRIICYEDLLNKCTKTIKELEDALEHYREIRGDMDLLEKYYTGPEWKEDYDADDAGLLPEYLKRGVLSQDGIELLLEADRDVQEDMKTL